MTEGHEEEEEQKRLRRWTRENERKESMKNQKVKQKLKELDLSAIFFSSTSTHPCPLLILIDF